MSYKYETIQVIMEGAELLYSMLGELTDGISALPGCKAARNLKSLSVNISAAGSGIYHTMKNIAIESEEQCGDCYDDTDGDGADAPTKSDLNDFLDAIAAALSLDKPVSISADIYINEEKDGADNESEE